MTWQDTVIQLRNLGEEIRRFIDELHTRSKTCLVTNIARMSPYVPLMIGFQRVNGFSVSDHVLRNTAGFCRYNQELRTRQAIACTTSTTDHVEAKHGHHKLVCGLACECRDVRVVKHFVLRGSCTTDCHRNVESCVGAGIRSGPTPIVLGPIRSLDHRPVDFCLFPDVHTQLLVCDDIDDVERGFQDTLVLKFALVSSAHLRLLARQRQTTDRADSQTQCDEGSGRKVRTYTGL